MKKILLLCLVTLGVAQVSSAQMAGNSTYNQAADNYKAAVSEYAAPKANANYNYQQQTQTYYTNSAVANAYVVNDSVFELTVNALMNVHANSYVVALGVSQAAETIDSCQRM